MTSAVISYDSPEDQTVKSRLTLGDCFVVIAMALVAAALTVGLRAHFSIGLEVAAGVAAVGFVAMLAGHIALRRSSAAPPVAAANQQPNKSAATAVVDRRLAAPRAAAPKQPPTAKPAAVAKPAPGVTKAADAKSAAVVDDAVALQDLDLGNFRPRSPADLTRNPAAKPATDADGGGNIDDMIRRLADDIEAGRKPTPAQARAARDKSASPAAKQKAPAQQPAQKLPAMAAPKTAAPRQPASAGPKLAPPPLPATMPTPPIAPAGRPAFPPSMVEAATTPILPANAAAPTATAKLAAIADALSDEQLEVCLETINDLEDYRAQHYEVSVRLQLADGEVLNNDAFIAETRGTGLLPLLEAVKVSSTKRVAVQMIRRGRSGEFFSTVDGEALADRQFSEDVDTITGGDPTLAARLVLAFTQSDVRSLTPAQLFTLESIAALGFRFSIEGISDLDMDFEELAGRGFVFAKLDADVFLNGLPIGTTRVPASDICHHLAKAGLSLIVGKINDETARAKILGFGAVLGQGALFGAPRPVRADVLRPGEQRPPAS